MLSEEYGANIHTLDVDFLLKNLKRPIPPYNLMKLVRENGYGAEIEFLLAKRGAGNESALKTNLGVRAPTWSKD